ncbi:MAG: hypothetical protein RhofKO_18220 [Rhodothermales bacterium]
MPDERRWPLPERKAATSKVTRITEHTRGLVDDVKEWVELRIQVAQLEVQQTVEQKLNQAIIGGILAVLALFTVSFLLIALALGLGAWLGHAAWGFLVVGGLLGAVTAFFAIKKPTIVQFGDETTVVNVETPPIERAASPPLAQPVPPPVTPTSSNR